MEKISIALELRGYKILDKIYSEPDGLSHIYATKGLMSYCVIAPHKGNNYKYLLRKNLTEYLDRWGNCDFEKSYDNPASLIRNLDYTKDLEEYIKMDIAEQKEREWDV